MGSNRTPTTARPDPEAFDRLNRLIGSEQFHVELGRVYRLEDAEVAHREIEKHHLGKLAFRGHRAAGERRRV